MVRDRAPSSAILSDDRTHFLKFPHTIGGVSGHRGRDAQRLVEASEVVSHEVKRDVVLVIRDIF